VQLKLTKRTEFIRVGFLPAETCFCRTCGLNQFKPEKNWKLVLYRYE